MTGDPLTDALLQRQIPQVPPNPAPRLPPQVQRWANSQQIQDAYQNGWAPNPVLLRAQLGK